jgi:hypothetical protein
MAANLQQPYRLSSDVTYPEMSVQARQALVAQARQQRIELELESNASIARRYRDLVGRGASPAEIAQGLRDAIRMQATSGHSPARDQRVLAERAPAEADRRSHQSPHMQAQSSAADVDRIDRMFINRRLRQVRTNLRPHAKLESVHHLQSNVPDDVDELDIMRPRPSPRHFAKAKLESPLEEDFPMMDRALPGTFKARS